MTGQCAGKREFGHAFRKGHHCSHGHCRIATDKDVDTKRLLHVNRGLVLNPDTSMNLIMQTNFAIRLIFVASQLDSIHAEI